jgi:hypothetical protein
VRREHSVDRNVYLMCTQCVPSLQCDVNIVLTVELTDEEISSIVLDPKEYVESKWIGIANVYLMCT